MKEEENLYLYEDDIVKFCFTKRNMDAKNISNIKKVLGNYFSMEVLSYAKQVHGNKIYEINNKTLDFTTECDGLITNKINMPLLIFTADCLPIIFYDKEKKVIALGHAGWQGTYLNIAGKIVEKMLSLYDCKLENINVFIGPHISVENYEVSLDLINKFQKFRINSYYKKNNDGYFLDLEGINKYFLLKSGILEKNIISSGFCTIRDNNKFFSYRKDNKTKKRIATIIELK